MAYTPIGADENGKLPPEVQASLSSTFAARGAWESDIAEDFATLAGPVNTPTITYLNGTTTTLASPVQYRPSICGTGALVSGWDGRNDPVFFFHSGVFNTANGASQDLALNGTTKPGGGAQAARWPIIFEVDTSAGVSVVELVFYGSTSPSFKVEVNGQPAIADRFLAGPTGLGSGKTAVLTFPDARQRRLRIYMDGGIGLYYVRVPSGQSLSKPAITRRTGVALGDSWINGAGNADGFPIQGATAFETYAIRVLRSLGCNDFALAGIGGSGFVAGMDGGTPNPYSTRVATVLGFAPAVLFASGSINDGTAGAGVQEAVEDFADMTAAVPERYLIGTAMTPYETNHDAVRAGAAAAAVPFVDMRAFMFGTGNVANPNGSGNNDLLRMADNAHPTFVAHRALERTIISKIAQLRAAGAT